MAGSRNLDITRAGSREYTPEQERRVLAAIQNHVGGHAAVTTAQFSNALGIDGRVVRAVLSAHDGVDLLVGGGDDGLYLCEYADESEAFTHRLIAGARQALARSDRRAAYAASMPRRQFKLL